jgi:hypothetical protein
VPARRKAIDNFKLYMSKLNDCDIYTVSDIEEFELRIAYEVEDLDRKYESKKIQITPFEVK